MKSKEKFLKEIAELSKTPLTELRISRMPFGNRYIEEPHVGDLMNSMRQYGNMGHIKLVYTNLFNGNWELYPIDGNHTLEAAKRLNLVHKLSFTICRVMFESIGDLVGCISSMNNLVSTWKLQNYINSYADIAINSQRTQFNHYVKLRRIYQLYGSGRSKSTSSSGISYALLAIIFGRQPHHRASQDIKSGKFKIIDEDSGHVAVRILLDIQKELGFAVSTAFRPFCYEFMRWYNPITFNPYMFLKYVRKNIEKLLLLKQSGIADFLRGFSETNS